MLDDLAGVGSRAPRLSSSEARRERLDQPVVSGQRQRGGPAGGHRPLDPAGGQVLPGEGRVRELPDDPARASSGDFPFVDLRIVASTSSGHPEVTRCNRVRRSGVVNGDSCHDRSPSIDQRRAGVTRPGLTTSPGSGSAGRARR